MKKITAIVSTIACGALMATACLPLAACDGLFSSKTHVSTLSELVAATGKNIVLDADIDGNGENMSVVACKSVDGNGHTISNVKIETDGKTYSISDHNGNRAIENASMFYTSSVKNLTLDSITLIAAPFVTSTNYSVGFVCSQTKDQKNKSYQLQIENVHVKNSTMKVTQNKTDQNHRIGAIAGSMSCYSDIVGAEFGESYLRNCTVDNVTIVVDSAESENKSSIIVGGLIGTANGEISNCAVTNSTISVTGNSYMSTPYVGGIVGTMNGEASLSNSYAKGNTITAQATWSLGNILNFYSTATVYAGGAIGSAAKGTSVTTCYATENKIYARSSGEQCIGGFIGTAGAKISQCYSTDSNFKIGGRQLKDKGSVTLSIGGFCGYAIEAEITSSFVINNEYKFYDEEYLDGTKLNEIREGGFAGTAKDAKFSECATCAIAVGWLRQREYTYDIFCCTKLEEKNISNCYYDGSPAIPINKCNTMTEEEWFDATTAKTNLKLNDSQWVFEAGKYPVLDLG